MAKTPRKTNCCDFSYTELEDSPLKLKHYGAECTECNAIYLLSVDTKESDLNLGKWLKESGLSDL